VIVPAFNAAADIPAALASVFAQSFGAFEVIVVNDGSSDDLETSLRPFRDRIIYLEQPNRGAAARNAGIRAARGQYIAFLDADDVWSALVHGDLSTSSHARRLTRPNSVVAALHRSPAA
jgi:glycosyltransferase involved in cell wall biosynthesis